jgi:hypothetical protein
MDGQTLLNLEIFRNSFDGGASGMSADSTFVLLSLFFVPRTENFVTTT